MPVHVERHLGKLGLHAVVVPLVVAHLGRRGMLIDRHGQLTVMASGQVGDEQWKIKSVSRLLLLRRNSITINLVQFS